MMSERVLADITIWLTWIWTLSFGALVVLATIEWHEAIQDRNALASNGLSALLAQRNVLLAQGIWVGKAIFLSFGILGLLLPPQPSTQPSLFRIGLSVGFIVLGIYMFSLFYRAWIRRKRFRVERRAELLRRGAGDSQELPIDHSSSA